MPRKGIAARVAVEVLAVLDLEPEMVEGRTAAQRKATATLEARYWGQPIGEDHLEVYARKVERKRDTGERMDALIRGADWAQTSTSDDPTVAARCRCGKQKPRRSGAVVRLRGKDSNLDYLIQSQASYH